MKNSDVFHIPTQNRSCGYSLEPPPRGGSNQYPQSMFLSRNKKIMYTPVNPIFILQKCGFRGSKLYRHVFVMIQEELLRKNSDCLPKVIRQLTHHSQSAYQELYVVFELSSFVPHLSFFYVPRRLCFRDCDIAWAFSLIILHSNVTIRTATEFKAFRNQNGFFINCIH